jgi:hypothetical protein
MLNRTKEAKRRIPITRLQKGKRYAFLVMLLGLAYSTYANVRSGAINAEPIVTSVVPTIVFFGTVHLIAYYNPKNKFEKGLVWFGLGFVALVAFGISGFHIWELTVRNGQHWIVSLFYPFIIDIPTALATIILIQKVSTNAKPTKEDKPNEMVVSVQSPQKQTKAPIKRAPRKAVPTTTKPQIQDKVSV